MNPILEIHKISKRFFIDHERPSYLSFRDHIANIFTRRSKPEEFWALRDVSFDVLPGDSIGIIGRNGAGKSTLLKILSRITPPTGGHIVARGRVASLLEVGTGFHQELTGRENIFMNGSILGLKRIEIKKRFDEIVDFSGVEKFLDTPLKHYSSGMQLRLAFAVAAHLEPEILIVDEVLAVGDHEFQKKCLGKMGEVNRSGRTLLFVSHNLEAVQSLCTQSIYLSNGKVEYIGDVYHAIRLYNQNTSQSFQPNQNDIIKKIEIVNETDGIRLLVVYKMEFEINYLNLGFVICDSYGRAICGTNVLKEKLKVDFGMTSSGSIQVLISSPRLAAGRYQINIWFGDKAQNYFKTSNPVYFEIVETNGVVRNTNLDGFVIPDCAWQFNK